MLAYIGCPAGLPDVGMIRREVKGRLHVSSAVAMVTRSDLHRPDSIVDKSLAARLVHYAEAIEERWLRLADW
jgi:hypothetical protein